MRSRMPRPILNQNWTIYTFLYVEAYFRYEQYVINAQQSNQTNRLRWVKNFAELFQQTFEPYSISLDDLRQKYVWELIGRQ
jgi:hypothetical protein